MTNLGDEHGAARLVDSIVDDERADDAGMHYAAVLLALTCKAKASGHEFQIFNRIEDLFRNAGGVEFGILADEMESGLQIGECFCGDVNVVQVRHRASFPKV